MSISALSSNLINDLSQQQNPFRQIRQDFGQLANALQSGDLSGAQSAYSNLQQLLQSRPGASNANSNAPNTIQTDFASLGQALQSGDLNQAQSVFAQLQKDLQAARHAPPAPPPDQDQYVPSTSLQGLSIIQQVQQDFGQLNSALQSGDLAGAQSAYANLQQALQTQETSASTANSPSATSSGTDTISNDFTALGQALSSGNLSQAQTAFTQLRSDIQTAQQSAGTPESLTEGLKALVQGSHHHHHHHGGGESASQNSTATPATVSTDNSTGNGAGSSVSLYA